MMSILKRGCFIRFIFLGFIFLVSSCAYYIPDQEIMLAEEAVEAARDAKADVYSPSLFSKAEDYLKAAKKARRDREFEDAAKFSLLAKQYAEKAENESVVKYEQNK